MINKNDLWCERYRPKSLKELVLDEEVYSVLNKFVKEESIPHLLLTGNVGCGKTTIAKILLSILDCDSLSLNASDERGIDIVRNKIKQFAMFQSFKKWKIVFLDEFDAMTVDAQFSLRNIFETYSEHTRFILTCNYLNKVIEPLRSRCQLIEFKDLHRKQIRNLLVRILSNEGVGYNDDDLLIMIDMYYPDIRSMINHLQLYSKDGKWELKGVDTFRNFEQLLDYIKKKDLKGVRELSIDYTEAFRYLFDKVDEFTEDYSKRVSISLDIAEYLWREAFIADKSINFLACCLVLMEKI